MAEVPEKEREARDEKGNLKKGYQKPIIRMRKTIIKKIEEERFFEGKNSSSFLSLSEGGQELFCLCQGFGLPDVDEAQCIGQTASDTGFAASLEVKVHNRKFAGPPFVHVMEQGRRDHMNAAECIFAVMFRIVCEAFGLGLQGIFVDPSAEAFFIVDRRVADRFPSAGQQGSIISALPVIFIQGFQVSI